MIIIDMRYVIMNERYLKKLQFIFFSILFSFWAVAQMDDGEIVWIVSLSVTAASALGCLSEVTCHRRESIRELMGLDFVVDFRSLWIREHAGEDLLTSSVAGNSMIEQNGNTHEK